MSRNNVSKVTLLCIEVESLGHVGTFESGLILFLGSLPPLFGLVNLLLHA